MVTDNTEVVYGLYPDPTVVDAVCLGSGRFLRSVLVPALNAAGLHPAIVQTRGRTFLDHCLEQREAAARKKSDASVEERYHGDDGDGVALEYEVDTVEYEGGLSTEKIACYGAGTMGSDGGKAAVLKLLDEMKTLTIVGVGVTEAGLSSSSSQSMIDLCALLRRAHSRISSKSLTCPNPHGRICVVNTDNVPKNGAVVRKHVLEIAKREGNGGDDADGETFVTFLQKRVAFLDTMVDRITSQREGSNGLVPRCEPIPSKALVVEDLGGDLPAKLGDEVVQRERGVVVRSSPVRLDADVALKLRVANGTHTAAAQVMALCGMVKTDSLSPTSDEYDMKGKVIMEYLDSLFSDQILPGAAGDSSINCTADDVTATWYDWRRRLTHPHFGLSTFFISQNCAAKGGIRLGPTSRSLLLAQDSNTGALSVGMAFALAAILRFLTPADSSTSPGLGGAYRGWLDGADRCEASKASGDDDGAGTVAYADGLRYDLSAGWYEFRCDCSFPGGVPLPARLAELSSSAASCRSIVRAYLVAEDGGNLDDVAADGRTKGGFDALVERVAALYARMVAGDGMLNILGE